jgi:hypothetical protein
MNGQGLVPRGWHPFVDNPEDREISEFMDRTRAQVAQIVERQPDHADFLASLARTA